ncbi:MAG: HDIG domain-containing protein [Planctomycetota bacterium]|nr:HDIG domain-containing protein [Planctomycetota bacterium]
MKSRLEGFKARRKQQQASRPSQKTGASISAALSFAAVLILLSFIAAFNMPALAKFDLNEKAPDDYYSRVDFKSSPEHGMEEIHSAGEKLIEKGMVVDDYSRHLLRLEQEAFARKYNTISSLIVRYGSVVLIVLASMLLFVLLCRELNGLDRVKPVQLFFLGAALAGIVLTGKLIGGLLASTYLPLTPLALFAIVAAIGLGPKITSLCALFSLPLFAYVFAPHYDVALAMCFSGALAPYLSYRSKKRNDLLKAGLVIGCLYFIMILSLSVLSEGELSFSALKTSLSGLLCGFASGAAATFLFPIFEWMFGVVTGISLLELSDLDHPLLKRMLMEAPGTYQHSLIVATISEHAAESIGANALLAKVGAYFHDIGKMVRPKYFTENNTDATELHSKLKYSMSAMLIISHIKDGEELAREYNLPDPIIDIIREHQGTTLVEYFYRKALESGESLALPDMQVYQYPGPKPRSKESAIVMIADAIEALTRSLKTPSYRKIQESVHKIIRKKLNDRQFDECDITMHELNTIEKSVSWIVQSMFHTRVEYPKDPSEESSSERPTPSSFNTDTEERHLMQSDENNEVPPKGGTVAD